MLGQSRNDTPPKGLGWVHRIEEARVIGGDGRGKTSRGMRQGCLLFLREVEELGQGMDIRYTVTKLPLPVIPLTNAGFGKKFLAEKGSTRTDPKSRVGRDSSDLNNSCFVFSWRLELGTCRYHPEQAGTTRRLKILSAQHLLFHYDPLSFKQRD